VYRAHPSRPGIVTVPHPKKDILIGTLKSIARYSGVKLMPPLTPNFPVEPTDPRAATSPAPHRARAGPSRFTYA
jgi:hypothetical protein